MRRQCDLMFGRCMQQKNPGHCCSPSMTSFLLIHTDFTGNLAWEIGPLVLGCRVSFPDAQHAFGDQKFKLRVGGRLTVCVRAGHMSCGVSGSLVVN